MSESAKSRLAEAVAAQKKRPVTSGMVTSELPVYGSNRISARIQTARSTPRLPKCRRLQRLLEVNRKDEMRGGSNTTSPSSMVQEVRTTIPNKISHLVLAWSIGTATRLPAVQHNCHHFN